MNGAQMQDYFKDVDAVMDMQDALMRQEGRYRPHKDAPNSRAAAEFHCSLMEENTWGTSERQSSNLQMRGDMDGASGSVALQTRIKALMDMGDQAGNHALVGSPMSPSFAPAPPLPAPHIPAPVLPQFGAPLPMTPGFESVGFGMPSPGTPYTPLSAGSAHASPAHENPLVAAAMAKATVRSRINKCNH